MQITGVFSHLGRSIVIDKDGIKVADKEGAGMHELALVGGVLQANLVDASLAWRPQTPGLQAFIISCSNKTERLWKAKDAWRKLKAERVGAEIPRS